MATEPAETRLVHTLVGSALSGLISRLPCHPLDTIKSRLQSATGSEYRSTLHCCRRTFAEEGIRGFYRGFGIVATLGTPGVWQGDRKTLLMDLIVQHPAKVYISTYEILKSYLAPDAARPQQTATDSACVMSKWLRLKSWLKCHMSASRNAATENVPPAHVDCWWLAPTADRNVWKARSPLQRETTDLPVSPRAVVSMGAWGIPGAQQADAFLGVLSMPAPSAREADAKAADVSDSTVDDSKDEGFQSLCRVCRAQNVEYTSDLVIVARPRMPKLLLARRSAKARNRSPEHLHLDRRQLGRCPVLEEEARLRLLNYQNNAISRIEHLDNLPNLTFLDLYDNKIQVMENLEKCKNLRVLMLGKNQIQRIENLKTLEKLDVLDLHSNRIKEIQNVSHLTHLRVLNLAGNFLPNIFNLDGLVSLTELNIRRNSISTTAGVDQVPQLQRLFASHNNIVLHEDLRFLSAATNLRELTLDGNPISDKTKAYHVHIVTLCPNLETLDNVKVEARRCIRAKPEFMEALEAPSQRSDAEIQASSSSVPDQPEQSGEDSEPTEPPVCIRSFVISPSPSAALNVAAATEEAVDTRGEHTSTSNAADVPLAESSPPPRPKGSARGRDGLPARALHGLPKRPTTATARPSPAQPGLTESLAISSIRSGTNLLQRPALPVSSQPMPMPKEQKTGSMTSEEVLQAIRLQWELVLQGKVAMTRHGYVRREQAAELSIFGRGLDALDKIEYQSVVTSIHFHYILIEMLAGEIARLLKFKVLNSITFVQNQILDPRALEPFRRMPRLTSIVIKENPVCSGRATLRVGIIRWLPHLRKINDQDVTDLERADACNLQAALPVLSSPDATDSPEDLSAMVEGLISHACTVDERISAVHEHFGEIVRDAIREVWYDLAETSGTVPAMPLPSTGDTLAVALMNARLHHRRVERELERAAAACIVFVPVDVIKECRSSATAWAFEILAILATCRVVVDASARPTRKLRQGAKGVSCDLVPVRRFRKPRLHTTELCWDRHLRVAAVGRSPAWCERREELGCPPCDLPYGRALWFVQGAESKLCTCGTLDWEPHRIGLIRQGYYATLASFGPFSALYFAFYEQARFSAHGMSSAVSVWVPAKEEPKSHCYQHYNRLAALLGAEKSLPPALTLLASASAGTAVVTCPLDLAKLRLQTQLRLPPGVEIPEGHLHGLRAALVASSAHRRNLRLWKKAVLLQSTGEGGVRALFRGAGARAAFHAPSTCITFTTFEELARNQSLAQQVAYNIRRIAALAAACYVACIFPRAFVSPTTQRQELTQSQGFVRSDRQVVMQADARPSMQTSSESASFSMLGRASAAALCALVAVSADRRSRQRAEKVVVRMFPTRARSRQKTMRRFEPFGEMPAWSRKPLLRKRLKQPWRKRPTKKLSMKGRYWIERSRVACHYNINIAQLTKYVLRAFKEGRKHPIDCLMQILESRIDNFLWRVGLAPTMAAARWMVRENHIQIRHAPKDSDWQPPDWVTTNVPSTLLMLGDEIRVRPKKRSIGLANKHQDEEGEVDVPGHLEWDRQELIGRYNDVCDSNEIGINVCEDFLLYNFLGPEGVRQRHIRWFEGTTIPIPKIYNGGRIRPTPENILNMKKGAGLRLRGRRRPPGLWGKTGSTMLNNPWEFGKKVKVCFVRSDRQVVMQADARPSLQTSSESASFSMLGRASAAALCALVAVSADSVGSSAKQDLKLKDFSLSSPSMPSTPLPAPQPIPDGYNVAPPPARPLLLFITNVKNARTVWVEISINDNVHMLKRYTSRKMLIPVEDMILVYQGEELKNDTQIKQSKLDFVIQKAAEGEPSAEDCTIHLIDIKDTPAEIREQLAMGCRSSKRCCCVSSSCEGQIENGPADTPGASFRSTRYVLNRETGKVFEEVIPGPVWSILKGLYATTACGIVPAHPLRCCLRRLTQHAGRKMRSASSKKDVRKFVDVYSIDMEEVLLPLSEFRTMNDFFTRELKPGARPVDCPEDATVFVSSADCRAIVFPNFEEAARVWIKGYKFSVAELLGNSAAAEPFLRKSGCSVAVLRLAPQDYHRFHFPCGPGQVLSQKCLSGEYYSVNPVAINNSSVDVLTENCRSVSILQHAGFGLVAFVAVGATLVGSVELLRKEGSDFQKGDCYGYFQ
ncbi:PSD3 [Symbiodinium sp. CCMP2456]|nr:PSD3 [Symbiodinium sp. CCMP2456]